MITDLSPDIREIVIGKRIPTRPLKLYPLSVGDQLKMTDIIAEMVAEILAMSADQDDKALILTLFPIVAENIKQVLKYVIDEEEDIDEVLNMITNVQLEALAEAILDVNYAMFSKNGKGLFKKIQKKLLSLMQSSPKLSQEQVTESLISSSQVKEEE